MKNSNKFMFHVNVSLVPVKRGESRSNPTFYPIELTFNPRDDCSRQFRAN